jgi:hypothetical protein
MIKKELQLELQFVKKIYIVKKDLHSNKIILFKLFYLKDCELHQIIFDDTDIIPFDRKENGIYKVIDPYNIHPDGIINIFSDWLYGIVNRFEAELI